MAPEVRIIGIEGIPEVRPGDDLVGLILDAANARPSFSKRAMCWW